MAREITLFPLINTSNGYHIKVNSCLSVNGVVSTRDVTPDNYTFEKRYYVFHLSTRFVCLSVCLCVCLCVCHQDCGEIAGLSNTVLHEAITLDNSSTLQHYQDDPFPFPFHMGHQDKITFWAIISKLMNGFTPNLNSM